MEFNINKLEFKGKLAGTEINFGTIENREEFFNFLVEADFLEYGTLVNQKGGKPFHTYMVLRNFNYTSSWVQDHSKLCDHHVGANGSMLVDKKYRAMGYRSQINSYG